MSKVYVGDIGTTLIVDTNADLTGYDETTGLQLYVKAPDTTTETWTCEIPSGYDEEDGLMSVTVDGVVIEWDQAGTWTFQAHVLYTGGNEYLGETFTVTVYPAWS